MYDILVGGLYGIVLYGLYLLYQFVCSLRRNSPTKEDTAETGSSKVAPAAQTTTRTVLDISGTAPVTAPREFVRQFGLIPAEIADLAYYAKPERLADAPPVVQEAVKYCWGAGQCRGVEFATYAASNRALESTEALYFALRNSGGTMGLTAFVGPKNLAH